MTPAGKGGMGGPLSSRDCGAPAGQKWYRNVSDAVIGGRT